MFGRSEHSQAASVTRVNLPYQLPFYSPLTWHGTPEYTNSRTTPLLAAQTTEDPGSTGGSHDHNHRRTGAGPASAHETRLSGAPVFLFSEASPRQKSQYGEADTFFLPLSLWLSTVAPPAEGIRESLPWPTPPPRRPELRPMTKQIQLYSPEKPWHSSNNPTWDADTSVINPMGGKYC
ncbi:hypothetical protein E2C01_007237 [Portunus trituberculatus]|uniref:Uncharacterized protein n=1 Tax=Portunus trituberculatus TaxID=210409 RepID=A0A5B7CYM7_PORTR|nr:hypothetical protein [Portunus trituberculatus]